MASIKAFFGRVTQDPTWARRTQQVSLVLLAAILVAFFAKSASSIMDKTDGYDFYLAARALWEGNDPREVMMRESGYITYPPSAAILFLPLVPLGLLGYAIAWSALNIALIIAIPFLAMGIITGRARGHRWWTYVVPALVCGRVLENNNGLAQSNVLIGFGCLLGIYWFRFGRPWRAGLVIAAMAAIKITPGLFGVYFLWKRQWKAAMAMVLGACLFFGLLPAIAYGPLEVPDHYSTWIQQTEYHFLHSEAGLGYQPGQSIRSTLHHLLTRSSVESEEEYFVNVLELPTELINTVAPVLSILLLIGLLAVSRSPTVPRSAPHQYLEMALVMVAMLLMSPYVRKAHYAMLYPAFALATAALFHGVFQGRAAKRLKWSMIAFAVVVNFSSRGFIGRTASNFTAALSFLLWPTILFGLALGSAICAGRITGGDRVQSDP